MTAAGARATPPRTGLAILGAALAFGAAFLVGTAVSGGGDGGDAKSAEQIEIPAASPEISAPAASKALPALRPQPSTGGGGGTAAPAPSAPAPSAPAPSAPAPSAPAPSGGGGTILEG